MCEYIRLLLLSLCCFFLYNPIQGYLLIDPVRILRFLEWHGARNRVYFDDMYSLLMPHSVADPWNLNDLWEQNNSERFAEICRRIRKTFNAIAEKNRARWEEIKLFSTPMITREIFKGLDLGDDREANSRIERIISLVNQEENVYMLPTQIQKIIDIILLDRSKDGSQMGEKIDAIVNIIEREKIVRALLNSKRKFIAKLEGFSTESFEGKNQEYSHYIKIIDKICLKIVENNISDRIANINDIDETDDDTIIFKDMWAHRLARKRDVSRKKICSNIQNVYELIRALGDVTASYFEIEYLCKRHNDGTIAEPPFPFILLDKSRINGIQLVGYPGLVQEDSWGYTKGGVGCFLLDVTTIQQFLEWHGRNDTIEPDEYCDYMLWNYSNSDHWELKKMWNKREWLLDDCKELRKDAEEIEKSNVTNDPDKAAEVLKMEVQRILFKQDADNILHEACTRIKDTFGEIAEEKKSEFLKKQFESMTVRQIGIFCNAFMAKRKMGRSKYTKSTLLPSLIKELSKITDESIIKKYKNIKNGYELLVALGDLVASYFEQENIKKRRNQKDEAILDEPYPLVMIQRTATGGINLIAYPGLVQHEVHSYMEEEQGMLLIEGGIVGIVAGLGAAFHYAAIRINDDPPRYKCAKEFDELGCSKILDLSSISKKIPKGRSGIRLLWDLANKFSKPIRSQLPKKDDVDEAYNKAFTKIFDGDEDAPDIKELSRCYQLFLCMNKKRKRDEKKKEFTNDEYN